MYLPARDDELTGLVNYLDQQLDALRASLLGLTEEQAHATPTRSSLSLGGILKHIEYGMRGAQERLADENGTIERNFDEDGIAQYQRHLVLDPDESAAELLTRFDKTRIDYLAAIRAADPDADILEPPAPWAGVYQPTPAKMRYYLVQQVEEFARHAGHADIIREQLDGMSVPALVMTLAGAPANPFFTPYEPAPGTLLAS